MLNLGGLSAAYPGYQAAEATQATTETNQAAAKEAALKLLGQHVLGRALTGAPPDQGPQPPAPGQPSVPSAPQGGGPAAPPVQGGLAPTPAPAASVAPSGTPEITLQALTQRILATSPRVKDHPEVLMAALERAAPLLDRQSKEDLAELRKEMSTQRLSQAGELARARQESLNTWRGQQGGRADRRLDQRDDAQESLETYRKRTGDQRDAEEIGRNGRMQAKEAGTQGRFDAREARLAASTAVRQDQGWQRLEQQRQDIERKVQQGGDRTALSQWRTIVDAQHKRATEIIQSNSVMSGMKEEDKKAMLAEQRAVYEESISAMRGKMSQPAGAPASPAAPVPAASTTPPLAVLKPNTITTFANGQKWTIGPDGQPKQVP